MSNNDLIKHWANNDKRRSFLEAYQDWGVWFTTSELGLTWYRYTTPNGVTIIAMEYEHEVYDSYPNKHKTEITVRYYIQREGKSFNPGSHSSIWGVADLLKEAKRYLMNESKKPT